LSDEILERAVLPGHEEPLRVYVAVNLEAVEQLVDELAERLRVQTLGGRPVPWGVVAAQVRHLLKVVVLKHEEEVVFTNLTKVETST
jgi:DNA-binding ferritin-like protein